MIKACRAESDRLFCGGFMRDKLIAEAKLIKNKLIKHSQFLRSHAESGFDLKDTLDYAKKQLTDMGITPQICGRCGIMACVEGDKKGKTFLLRADMDALLGCDTERPNESVHACGHHMHTAMLLGAAEILRKSTDMLCGSVRLMFQPAEEILEGAKDMIENGILDDPVPDGGMMLHVSSGVDLSTGSFSVTSGISAPSADFFSIEIVGKGTHGALPHLGKDPIAPAIQIISALWALRAREFGADEFAVISIGRIEGGVSANTIPDRVILKGSARCFDEKTRKRIKMRMIEIVESISQAFGAEGSVEFTSSCPALVNDEALAENIYRYLSELSGEDNVLFTKAARGEMSGGSEDFAYISQKIPTVTVGIGAGDRREGYDYPLHHPKVRFDERALSIGAAALAYCAIRFLKE